MSAVVYAPPIVLGVTTVFWILLAMLLIVLTACLVVVYVAFPHRGQDVPRMAWVGRAMRRGVDRLPTLDNQAQQQAQQGRDGRDATARERETVAR